MEKIKLRVLGNTAEVTEKPAIITSGTVGLTAEFTFDSLWNGLSKVAVFRAGDTARSVTDLVNEAIIPWEVLEKPNYWLQIGVYGVNADGSVAIPTLWANVCVLHTGTNPEADPALDPTLPVWQEMRDTIAGLRQEALPEEVAEAICPDVEDPTPADALLALQKGKAPAGFGLGTSAVGVNDLNSFVRCGWSAFSSGCANAPFDYGVVLSLNRYGTQYTQVAFDPYMSTSGSIAVRHFNGTQWKEWEYSNPPMKYGVEYRTTERWNGKPVYTKLINLDSYIGNEEYMVDDTGYIIDVAYNVDTIVDAKFRTIMGVFYYWGTANPEIEAAYEVALEEGGVHVNLYNVYDDGSAGEITLLLKFTKTTD